MFASDWLNVSSSEGKKRCTLQGVIMANDVFVLPGIIIPGYELEVTTSRAGGPGGQHVNKSDTRITVRWNVKTTSALSDEQKARIVQNLQAQLTADGDILISNSESPSQQQNKEAAFERLAFVVHKALYVPKRRIKTRVPRGVKEARFQEKKHRGVIKKLRRSGGYDE